MITWTSSNFIGNVNIDLRPYNPSPWNRIATDIANDGSEPWIVGPWPNDSCQIRISSTGDPAIPGFADFVIYEPLPPSQWAWEKLSDVGPSPRYGHMMAYDSNREQIVLFGGDDGSQRLNDTWIYDIGSNSWQQLFPNDPTNNLVPQKRSMGRIVFDAANDRMILFGGEGLNNFYLNDIWAFDLNTNTWFELIPPNQSDQPDPRQESAMAYDPAEGCIVMFGGNADGPSFSDTWIFDCTTDQWTLAPITIPPPHGVVGGSMTYDSLQNRMILFGGWNAGQALNITWTYDYTTQAWNDLAPGNLPNARCNSSLVYFPSLDMPVMFGGGFESQFWNDTQVMLPYPQIWVNLTLAGSHAPTARAGQEMVYDSALNQIVLFGGHGGSQGSIYFGDTWAFREPTGNYPPVAQDQAVTTLENSSPSITLQATDPNLEDTLTYEVVSQPVHGILNGTAPNLEYTPSSYWNGTDSFTFQANDGEEDSNIATVTIVVTPVNYPPTLGAITVAPLEPAPINSPFTAIASFSDPDPEDTHTASWDWGDGSVTPGVVDEAGRIVSGTHSYATPGVYTLTLTLSDGQAIATATYLYIVVYDPTGGFVTGGGWINSPPGAYQPNPSLTGKANFGFEVKYKKGATVPSGNTEFQFHAGNLNFHSTSFEWLVIAGKKAQFKGEGTINGSGSYRFFLTVIDGQYNGTKDPDKFRIKIWDRNTNILVYDNLLNAPDDADPTTVIGGGNIVIHKP